MTACLEGEQSPAAVVVGSFRRLVIARSELCEA
jgi:hypothetical protein